MDLYQLRYFLEVARELSFTRAAENLRLSPPAVSRSVALLERSIGKPLLTRTKRRVALTTHGELLKARVERIYDELEKTEQELAGKRESGPSFLRIGSREMITDYLMPRPLLEFRERYPDTRFGIHELDPGEMAECLKKDQIDAGFYYFAIPDPALEVRRLGLLDSHICASPKLLGKRKAPRFEEVLKLPWIAPRYFRADPAAPSLDGFPDTVHKRNIQYEGEFLETHRRYVLDGVALAVLPDLVVREELKRGEVVRLKGPRLYREIFFMKRRTRALPAAVDQLCESIRAVIAKLGTSARG
jgi:DNA-binding transcriptional LysR family regulator